MLLRRECLRHNVCEIFESIDLSEFDNTGSVQVNSGATLDLISSTINGGNPADRPSASC